MLRVSSSQPNVFPRFGLLHSLTSAVAGGGTMVIALGLLESTGSATAFGMAMGAALVPVGLTTPLVGRWVDHAEPRRFLGATAWLTAFGAAGLAVSISIESFPIWADVLVLVLLQSALGAQTIAGGPFIQRWVARDRLSRANALLHVCGDSGRLAGASIGSFAFGGGWALSFAWAGVLTVLLAAAFVRRARSSVERPSKAYAAGPVASGSKLGFSLLRSAPLLAVLTCLFVFRRAANGGFDVLAPPVVLAYGSPNLVGIVMGACSAGYLCMGVWLTMTEIRRPLSGVITAATCSSIGLIAFGLFGMPALFVVLAFVIYAAEMLLITANELYWQRVVDPRVLGRAVALRSLVAGAGALLASVLAGPMASGASAAWGVSLAAGAETVLSLFGAGLLICVGVLTFSVARQRERASSIRAPSLGASPMTTSNRVAP